MDKLIQNGSILSHSTSLVFVKSDYFYTHQCFHQYLLITIIYPTLRKLSIIDCKTKFEILQ